MDDTGADAHDDAGSESSENRQDRVDIPCDEHGPDGGAERKAAVYRQIWEIQYFVGDSNTLKIRVIVLPPDEKFLVVIVSGIVFLFILP